MRALLVTIVATLSLAQLATADTYWVVDAGGLYPRQVNNGDSSKVKPTRWEMWLFKQGQSKTGQSPWGIITGKTSASVVQQLALARSFELDYNEFFGRGRVQDPVFTHFNSLGPIAVFERNSTAARESKSKMAKVLDLIQNLNRHWTAFRSYARPMMKDPRNNPYRGIGKSLREYGTLLAEAELKVAKLQTNLRLITSVDLQDVETMLDQVRKKSATVISGWRVMANQPVSAVPAPRIPSDFAPLIELSMARNSANPVKFQRGELVMKHYKLHQDLRIEGTKLIGSLREITYEDDVQGPYDYEEHKSGPSVFDFAGVDAVSAEVFELEVEYTTGTLHVVELSSKNPAQKIRVFFSSAYSARKYAEQVRTGAQTSPSAPAQPSSPPVDPNAAARREAEERDRRERERQERERKEKERSAIQKEIEQVESELQSLQEARADARSRAMEHGRRASDYDDYRIECVAQAVVADTNANLASSEEEAREYRAQARSLRQKAAEWERKSEEQVELSRQQNERFRELSPKITDLEQRLRNLHSKLRMLDF